ncbi:NAD(P)/FAD-dependent oxidoreductase [Candidatus Woesearchaeota archaeon]|nr:NAD(P)/FAD-dependent oxidoreductase [Candidatus Woesearchaeota archaeon]
MKVSETIIIGAGISGLGCARTLSDHQQEFKIITENIGGRILTSKQGEVQYGAYFIGEDYKNVLPFVKKTRPLNNFMIEFHQHRKRYFISKSLKYPLQLIRLLLILKKFKKHLSLFQDRCKTISQKEALQEDQYLYELYNKRTDVFIKEEGISEIVNQFLEEGMYGILFTKLTEVYALEFLRWSQYLITPYYEFIFLKDKVIKGFSKDIIMDTVISIKKREQYYQIKTKKQKLYAAKNIVIATPINVTQQLVGIKEIKKGINANMFHLKGTIKEEFSGGEFEVFSEGSPELSIAKQRDGTYVFYHKSKSPNFSKYFKSYKIIAKHIWSPAFNLNGKVLLEQKRGKNLYLATDHNVCGLEDSFITGIYAANQIIKNSKE